MNTVENLYIFDLSVDLQGLTFLRFFRLIFGALQMMD